MIREIVTKAIVGKNKKSFIINDKISPNVAAYSILGCWVINHQFEATLDGKEVTIEGSFEINVWHSSEDNTKTDVVKKIINYSETIVTKQVVKDYIDNSADVLVRVLQEPTCTTAKIIDNQIEIEVIFELIAELIGETKMQVSIINQDEEIEILDDVDEFDEIEDQIEIESIKE